MGPCYIHWGGPRFRPPHLKGYPNCTEMALISLVSPLHFTVAPVSPLKEPHAPKAKMAKSCKRGAVVGGCTEPWGPPLTPQLAGFPPGAESRPGRAGRAATPQLSAACASSRAAACAGRGAKRGRNGAAGGDRHREHPHRGTPWPVLPWGWQRPSPGRCRQRRGSHPARGRCGDTGQLPPPPQAFPRRGRSAPGCPAPRRAPPARDIPALPRSSGAFAPVGSPWVFHPHPVSGCPCTGGLILPSSHKGGGCFVPPQGDAPELRGQHCGRSPLGQQTPKGARPWPRGPRGRAAPCLSVRAAEMPPSPRP